MTNEDLADRIMARIEREQAIHKSSIVEELQLACAPAVNKQSMDGLDARMQQIAEVWENWSRNKYRPTVFLFKNNWGVE